VLRWKIYALFSVLLAIWGIERHLSGADHWHQIDIVGYPITAIALIGLIAYAFSLQIFSEEFWKFFQHIYFGWVVFSLRPLWTGTAPMGIKMGAIAILLAITGFNWLALYRLAGSPWDAILKRPTQ
jgi:hypothetical protein